MTSSTRARISRVAVLATAGALAVTLVPALQPAQAVEAPQFAYRNLGGPDTSMWVNAAVGGGTPDRLTNAGYQVYSYDVSGDGQTTVACMSQGAAAMNAYDRTYALLLTHHSTGGTTSKVLSTFCEANPVIVGATADAADIYWYADDTVYKFAAAFDAAGVITGTPSAVSTGQFLTAKSTTDGFPIEYATGLAVSPDGANAAVTLRSDSGVAGRVCLSTLAAKPVPATQPATPALAGAYCTRHKEYAYAAAATSKRVPTPNILTFTGPATAVFTLTDLATGSTQPDTAWSITPTAGPVAQTVFDGLYSLRELNGAWWAWQDTATTTQFGLATVSADPVATPWAAPTAWTDRTDGSTTADYIPVSAAPPAYVAPAVKAPAHATFTLAKSVAVYRSKVAYESYNRYLKDPLDAAYSVAAAAEVDRGALEMSVNGGATWTSLGNTTGRNPFALNGKWYFGYTPVLARNTLFRWTFRGSDFTEASTPIVRAIKVVPIVTVKKSISGRYTTVYGSATRKYGKVVLQRKTSLGWRAVKTVPMSSTGAYTFGRLLLAKGTYRAVTLADTSWAAGVRLFTV